ncbi:hypothetical protein Tco_0440615, partial [Tanacetum coccineum]
YTSGSCNRVILPLAIVKKSRVTPSYCSNDSTLARRVTISSLVDVNLARKVSMSSPTDSIFSSGGGGTAASGRAKAELIGRGRVCGG